MRHGGALAVGAATVMTGNAGSTTPRARATAATRVSSMSMLLGCTDSCSVSHSASVRIGPEARKRRARQARRRQLQQQPQQRRDPVAHLAAVDNHVDGSVLEQEFAALEALRQRFAHGLLDDPGTGEADQRAWLGEVQVPSSARLADTPPVVGSVITEMNGSGLAPGVTAPPRSRHLQQRIQRLLHAAPPLAEKHTYGRCSWMQ